MPSSISFKSIFLQGEGQNDRAFSASVRAVLRMAEAEHIFPEIFRELWSAPTRVMGRGVMDDFVFFRAERYSIPRMLLGFERIPESSQCPLCSRAFWRAAAKPKPDASL